MSNCIISLIVTITTRQININKRRACKCFLNKNPVWHNIWEYGGGQSAELLIMHANTKMATW